MYADPVKEQRRLKEEMIIPRRKRERKLFDDPKIEKQRLNGEKRRAKREWSGVYGDPKKEKQRLKRGERRSLAKKTRMCPYTCDPLPVISCNVDLEFIKKCKTPVEELQWRCKNPDIFHRFRIFDTGSFSRDYIFKSMLLSIYPNEITPVKYRVYNTVTYFFARNCVDAMARFIENGLLIPHPMKPFEMDIVLNFCTEESLDFDDSASLTFHLNNSFNVETNTLSLDSLSREEELREYYPLQQPSTLIYILEQSSRFYALKKLSLRHNRIMHIKDLSPLKFLQIESLDLSSNKISSIDDLEGLKMMEFLIDLNLQLNPILHKYDLHTYNYATDVKSVCNTLQTLDGVDVSSPSFKRNFICSSDAHDLCGQFLEHFFTLYDSEDRQDLAGLYNDNAVLSFSATIIPDQKNSEDVRLNYYGVDSPYIVIGVTDIMKFFREIGRITHDPYSFVCDLTKYTRKFAVLTVGGLFRESNQILGFSRTFVLKATGEKYCITNDQLLVYNALDYQLTWGFCYPRKVRCMGDLLPFYPKQFVEVECYIHLVTGLNLEFTRRILKFCKYDPEKTLIVFSELLINNKLPKEAFYSQSITSRDLERPFYEEAKEEALKKFDSVDATTIWNMLNEGRLKNTEAHMPKDRLKDKKIRLKPIFDHWRAKREAMPQYFDNDDDFPFMHYTPKSMFLPQPENNDGAYRSHFQLFEPVAYKPQAYPVSYFAEQFTSFDLPVNPMPLFQQIEPAFHDNNIKPVQHVPPLGVTWDHPFQKPIEQAPQDGIAASVPVCEPTSKKTTTILDSKKTVITISKNKRKKKRKKKNVPVSCLEPALSGVLVLNPSCEKKNEINSKQKADKK